MTGLWFWEHKPVFLSLDEWLETWIRQYRIQEYVSGRVDWPRT